MNAHVPAGQMTPAELALAAPALAEPASAEPAALRPIPPDRRVSQPAIIGTVVAADVVILLAAASLSLSLTGTAATWLTAIVSAALTGAIILILQYFWGYTIASLGSGRQQALRVAGAVTGAFAGVILALVVAAADMTSLRPWLMGYASLAILLLMASRLFVRNLLKLWTEQGRLARRAVIVGGGRPVSDLIESLNRGGHKSIEILGLFDDRGGDRSPAEVADYPKLGGFDEMVSFCREQNVDLIIITLPSVAEQRILYLLKKLWVLPIDIRISAVGSKLKLRPRAYSYIGRTPFLAVFDKPLTDWGQAVKAVEDRVLAAGLLVLLSPVMLAVALAVKFTSKGPILFKQTRYGFNNEKIGVYKFRSMYVDQCDANANRLVTKGDPRVTKIGAIIRKTSLDELPQLFNVLKGELSIVGPRPHAMQAKADGHIYDEVVEGYFARHRVKPGITGWAQINGWRGETDTIDKIERRVEYDLQYIDNWSVFFDLYILAMTPISLLNTKNAY